MIQHHDTLATIPECPVVLVMTARPSFKELDWSFLKSTSGQPGKTPLVIDTLGFLNSAALEKAGVEHRMLWAPAQKDAPARAKEV
jgi:hypothetical protein